jgi:hypothetical protein
MVLAGARLKWDPTDTPQFNQHRTTPLSSATVMGRVVASSDATLLRDGHSTLIRLSTASRGRALTIVMVSPGRDEGVPVMVNIVPVDRERHAGKGWRHPVGYGFVAGAAVAPLGWSEFASAAPAMPIGFVEQAGHYVPVALLALAKGRNLFVEPITGRWLGSYVPAMLRIYPFYLVRDEGREQSTLSIDEDSGLIVDEAGENVEKFFAADGTPSPTSNTLVEFLGRIEQDRTKVDLAVAVLAEAGVVKPWPLTVPVGNQNMTLNGIHRIDEAALNALGDESFLKLRKASALVVAYGQLFSMGQVGVLARLSLMQQGMAQPSQGAPSEQTAPAGTLPV